jgi:hypothetical protein
LSSYCHDLSQIDGAILIEQFQDLVAHADDVRTLVPQRLEASKCALEEQYELLFGHGVISEAQAADIVLASS